MTIEELRTSGYIIFESIAGSRAYGLASEASDTDIRGVFVLPPHILYGLNYIEQVHDEQNNVVFYEIGKVVELLLKNNPTMLEMLAMPTDCILYKHKAFDMLTSEIFVSKLCKDTFAGYAHSQIKKAKGLNKKIVNPVDKKKKSVLDFCYVQYGQGSKPLTDWLKENSMSYELCGLVKIPHFRDCYTLYYNNNKKYAGIVHSIEESNDVCLSSVEEGTSPLTIVSFNKDGYSRYCKDYQEYWNWVEHRNEERFRNTVTNEKNYDAKNMMHVFRLLDMAEEIASGILHVRRPNRTELLEIKRGVFEYDVLLEMADKKLQRINNLYESSVLQESPDITIGNNLLVEIRKSVYASW
ncbi:MAG: nucleotidyltransferase domain-containing protein [Candidatus Kapaibacterium sp.]|nr:nucleotidyltransferase domain-containing protein [Bacteroidota bacterium]